MERMRLALNLEEAYRAGFEAGYRLIKDGKQYDVPTGKSKKEKCWLQGAVDGGNMACKSDEETKKGTEIEKPAGRS